MTAPIKNFVVADYPSGSVTQWFGENPDLYARFGLKSHNGIDIVAPWGEPLLAVEEGYVIDVKDTPGGYGKHLRFISRAAGADGWCREWTYGHCSAIHVKVGDHIQEGQHIADMGNTGFVVSGSTPFWSYNPYAGTHLHLGLRKIMRTPRGWSYTPGGTRFTIDNYDNGYKGAIDPAPFLASSEGNIAKMLTIISLQRKLIALLKRLQNTGS